MNDILKWPRVHSSTEYRVNYTLFNVVYQVHNGVKFLELSVSVLQRKVGCRFLQFVILYFLLLYEVFKSSSVKYFDVFYILFFWNLIAASTLARISMIIFTISHTALLSSLAFIYAWTLAVTLSSSSFTVKLNSISSSDKN